MNFKKLKTLLLETLFPRFCVGCFKEGSYICEDCAIFISETIPFCPVCKQYDYLGRRHKKCKGNLDGLTVLWDNQGVMKKAIEKIEDEGVFSIVDELIEFFIFILENDRERFVSLLKYILDERTVITFIPSGKKKSIGFDFGEIIADRISLISKRRKKVLFERKGDDLVFSDDKEEKVLLIQPIFSDGREMDECAKLLKKNGTDKVWGFSLVREC